MNSTAQVILGIWIMCSILECVTQIKGNKDSFGDALIVAAVMTILLGFGYLILHR